MFGLNRSALKSARVYAYVAMRAMLPRMLESAESGDEHAARELAQAILHQPSCVVLAAMRREAEKPGAAVVFSAEVLGALRHPLLEGSGRNFP